MTEQPQRSKLELYAQVIAAYQQAGIWPLFKHAYMKSGNEWRAKGWFWIVGILILAIIIYFIVTIFFSYKGVSTTIIGNVFFSLCILLTIEFFVIKDIANKLKKIFAGEMSQYRSLAKIYSEGWEFYRYILFRDELKKSQFKPEQVKMAMPLFGLDQQTLGSYVAQRPLPVWIASTLTAILAASATSWHRSWVALAVGIGVVAMGVLWSLPIFISGHKRRYELHRWLAWYKAEASTASIPPSLTPDGANRSPD